MARTEILSRRFRWGYRDMHASGSVSEALESVKRRGERVGSHLLEAGRRRKKKEK